MSEHEYDSTSCSETESDRESVSGSVSGSEESFSSMAAALESMREKLEVFGEGVEGLHEGVKHLETPVIAVALAQFVQPLYLEDAPFRKERFVLKEEAKRVLGLERDTAKFSTVCAAIRAYCFRHKLVNANGVIQVNEELKTLLGIQVSETTFLGILMHMNKIVE